MILPWMYVPAGIRIRSLSTYGNAVSAYTGSPSRAFLVEIACFKRSGTFVPAGIIALCGSGASATEVPAGAEVTAFLSFWGAVAGCVEESLGLVSAVWPNEIPEISSSVKKTRIPHLQGTDCMPQAYYGLAARMQDSEPGVIRGKARVQRQLARVVREVTRIPGSTAAPASPYRQF